MAIFSLRAQAMTEPQQSLEDVEAEMAALVRQEQAPLRRIEREQPRAVVSRHPAVSEAGELTARAMAAEYEKSAREMEATARALIALAGRCDQDTLVVVEQNDQVRAKIAAAVQECSDAATLLREEAKAIHDRLQSTSLMVDDVRRTVQAARDRIQARVQAMPAEPQAEPDEGEPDESEQ